MAQVPQERRDYLKGYQTGYRDGLAAGLSGNTAAPELLSLPLEVLGLSVRPLNCLRIYGCQQVADAVRLPAAEICRIPKLGKKSADEIARCFHAHGIFSTAWNQFLL